MKSTFVYPYKVGSVSAAGLANALGVKRIQHENSKFVGRKQKTVINWGASLVPTTVLACRIINHPEKVLLASNKLRFFSFLSDVEDAPRIPDWTLDPLEAASWLTNDQAKYVFARTNLTGHSGQGIVEYDNAEALAEAPAGVLYTKYIPKKLEYRVHVSRLHGVFSIQQKAMRLEAENPNFRIRNLANGFIYKRENLGEISRDVSEQAVKAIAALNLDFGAVDVIYNKRKNQAYVLEVNTAPGLEGTTVLEYANVMRELLNA